MNVVIIGGTRFIGRAVTQQLLAQGHRVAVFHRGHTPLEMQNVQEIFGDRRNLGWFRGAFKKFAPEVVIDMRAMTETDARGLGETFREVARRSVVLSSMDVYRAYDVLRGVEGEPLERIPFDEAAPLRNKIYPYRGASPRAANDPQQWVDDYDKILVEHVAAAEPKLPATILRLPMVYGEGDYQHRLFEYLKRMDDQRPAILLSETDAQWQTSRGYVQNVAAAIVRAAEDERAAHRTYNVADADVFATAAWIERVGRAAGWNGRVVIVPAEKIPDALRVPGNTRQSLVGDTTRIRQQIGYHEIVSTDDALARTIAWERANPPPLDPAQLNYALEDQVLASIL
ncbi:MAG: NAD-dependent epimerase/dehydratase family protein [Chloroflexi bacterium]|nr:NAD-dependent epimerase/dehydratase family protein [Chloroflexota bacterium]